MSVWPRRATGSAATCSTGNLSHDGDPMLARHVGHAVAKVTPFGTVITKAHPDSPRKIDVAVAAVIAYERACWLAANPRRKRSSW